jgi:hypothetical protein
LSINLVVLLLDGAKFLVREEDVFGPFSRATGGDALLLSVGFPSKQEYL